LKLIHHDFTASFVEGKAAMKPLKNYFFRFLIFTYFSAIFPRIISKGKKRMEKLGSY